MNCYERLVRTAERMGLYVVEKNFKSSAKGLCKGNKIGISKAIESNIEKRCILAEEIAHSFYTVGDILDQDNISNRKQEHFARKKAIEGLLPLDKFIKAYKHGARSCHEIAHFLEVTEEFLLSAVRHYQNKYGISTKHGRHIIYFSPLRIFDTQNENALLLEAE